MYYKGLPFMIIMTLNKTDLTSPSHGAGLLLQAGTNGCCDLVQLSLTVNKAITILHKHKITFHHITAN